MFISELCGSWIDHPFWKKAFLLDEPKDLSNLQQCGINEVWIDTDKGLDVEIVQQKAEVVPQENVGAEKKAERRVSLQEETQRAQQLQTRARKAVAAVFNDARLGNAMKVGETAALVDEITQSVSRNSGALISLARLKSRDDAIYLHSVAVCALMVALGKQMGMEGEQLRSLGIAGLLHDVGKTLIPIELLNKPGKLTDEEFKFVKTHPQRGWKLLKQSHDVDDVALDVCLHHHERLDGAGYPESLSGDAISQHARMAAICDAYDDLTSDSVYKKRVEPATAIRKMAEQQGRHFDPVIFQAFVKTVGVYPVGTLVKLKSGRLAVVTDQSAKSLLSPIVKVFFSTKSNEPIFPELVDISKVPDPIASVENPASWKLDLKAMAGI